MEETTTIPHKDIHEANNAIMQEVGYVLKSRSAGLNYSYAGEAKLIEAVRPYMVLHGVYCYILNMQDVARDAYLSKSGSAMTNTSVYATVRFVHVSSGTCIDVVVRGEGADSGDKSGFKAATGAYKYAIRQTYCIQTGDDPDKQTSEEQTPAAPKKNAVKELQKQAVDKCKALGGSANKPMMKVLEKYTPKRNPNSISDISKLTELLAELNQLQAI